MFITSSPIIAQGSCPVVIAHNLRQEFEEKLKARKRSEIVYVDEAGIDNREDYPYGYCEKGERFYDLKSGKRTERVSWIAALNEGRIFAPLTFKGSCNTYLFEAWVQRCLVPELIPGQIAIMDNASFHKSSKIAELIEEVGCELWYLPKYSPDLNKIERWWFVLKNLMKQRFDEFEDFWDCVDASFKNCPNVAS